MREVLSRHFEELVFRRINFMKGLQRTAASGFVGGVAGALMGATAFLAVNVLMPSSAEAQMTCRHSELMGTTTWSGPGGTTTCRHSELMGTTTCN